MPRKNEYKEALEEFGRDLKRTAIYGAAGLGAAVVVGSALKHQHHDKTMEPTQIHDTVKGHKGHMEW